MSHCNFPFSLQLLCPDEDDLTYISLCAGPELNLAERELVQSSCGLLQFSSCFFPGPWTRGGQMACSASAHAAQAQTRKQSISQRRTSCCCLLLWRKIKLSRCVCSSYCATGTTASAFQALLGEREQVLAWVHNPLSSFWHGPQGHPDSGLAL